MHQSVLLKEVVEQLEIKKDGRYIDGTLGLGGHAEAILQHLGPHGKLLGLDVDASALEQAKDRLQPFEDQTITRQVNFRGLQGVLRELGWTSVDGMLFDLGVSSLQLDSPERGFSFQADGPLDMRMNPQGQESVLSLLQHIDEEELANVLWSFGEKRHARRITRYLLHDIRSGRIQTTQSLAAFCRRVVGRRGQTHPATRVFLALRSLVNDEGGALNDLLENAPSFLNQKGRLAFITFHSLEDRAVKYRFKFLSQHGLGDKKFILTTKKPIAPQEEEVRLNARARSAKLRVLERVA